MAMARGRVSYGFQSLEKAEKVAPEVHAINIRLGRKLPLEESQERISQSVFQYDRPFYGLLE